MHSITVSKLTYAKKAVTPAFNLEPDELAVVKPGTYKVHWVADHIDHIQVSLVDPILDSVGKAATHNWYFYKGHLSGWRRQDLLEQSRNSLNPIPGAKDFTWGEATRDGSRPLPSVTVARNVIRVAGILQELRDYIKEPIIITSWYRDPETNRAVGGATYSRHVEGDGVDCYWHSAGKLEMRTIASKLVGNRGGVGTYPHNNIVHIDARSYWARW